MEVTRVPVGRVALVFTEDSDHSQEWRPPDDSPDGGQAKQCPFPPTVSLGQDLVSDLSVAFGRLFPGANVQFGP